MKTPNTPFLFLFAFFFLGGFFPVLLDKLELHLWFNSFHNGSLDLFFKYLTYLGDGLGILIFVIIFLFIEFKYSLLIVLGGYLPGLFTQFLKRMVFEDQYRPSYYFQNGEIELIAGVDMHQYFSFPSGHSTSAFALFCALSLIIKKPLLQPFFFFLAFTAGISRVYLHQHFFRDVWMGSFIGVIGCLLVFWFIYPRFSKIPFFNKSLLTPKS